MLFFLLSLSLRLRSFEILLHFIFIFVYGLRINSSVPVHLAADWIDEAELTPIDILFDWAVLFTRPFCSSSFTLSIRSMKHTHFDEHISTSFFSLDRARNFLAMRVRSNATPFIKFWLQCPISEMFSYFSKFCNALNIVWIKWAINNRVKCAGSERTRNKPANETKRNERTKRKQNAIKEYYLIDNSIFIHLQSSFWTSSRRFYYCCSKIWCCFFMKTRFLFATVQCTHTGRVASTVTVTDVDRITNHCIIFWVLWFV